jgi:hypothetical protein
MKGNIHLVRISNQKVIPALCLGKNSENYYLFAQIRKANEEDIFNTKDRKEMENFNKDRKERDQIKIRAKFQIDSVYIDQPKGINSKSVVMVKKLYRLKNQDVLKEIAKVSETIVTECYDLINQIKEIANLQKEMQMLKRKIQLAQMNNEIYTKYEIRIDQILKELGYPKIKKRKKKPYNNYREVPNKGYIKVYHGGR